MPPGAGARGPAGSRYRDEPADRAWWIARMTNA
jgi:hypothetical protein